VFRVPLAISIAGLAILVVGCEPAISDSPRLEFDDAWIRAPVAGATVTAGYCEITNTGAESVAVTGFSATTPNVRIEIHETTEADGMMRMRPLERLEIGPGETVPLAPGGKHLMLFGFDDAMTGTTLVATLASGDTLEIGFDVRPGANR